MDVGAYLRAARGTRRVSQRRLAALAGIPRSTLDRIEAGTSDPRLSTLTRIFGALGSTKRSPGATGAGFTPWEDAT